MSKNIDEIVLRYCPHGTVLDEDNEPSACFKCGSESRDAQVQNLAKKLTEAQQALTEKKLVVPMSEEEISDTIMKTHFSKTDAVASNYEIAKAIYERQFKVGE